MTKSIVAFFDSQDDAQSAVQDLVAQHITPERISLIAGYSDGSTADDEEAGTGTVAGGLAGLGILGLSTFLLPGVGMIVAGGPLAAAAAAGSNDEDDTPVDARLDGGLQGTGLTDVEMRGYSEHLRQGRTLVAVNADDEETDLVADVFQRHGGINLTFRRQDAS